MATRKFKLRVTVLVVSLIVALIGLVLFTLPTKEVYAAKPSNFLSARTTGTLNGTLQKQADNSVTFNGIEIASAQENLSQMYIFLQGAGGAGGFEQDSLSWRNVNAAGGAGSFAVVLVKFQTLPNGNGESYPILVSSGVGGTHGTLKRVGLTKLEFTPGVQPVDSKCFIDGIGSITAKAGMNADTEPMTDRTLGGLVETNALVNNFNDYMELKMQRNGCIGGSAKDTVPGEASLSFTVGMYKNGGWLTTKHFVHKVGGIHSGGGASPYSRGGNGAYADLITPAIYSYPEDAPSYGAGGGSAHGTMFLGNYTEEQRAIFRSGGRGGSGFVEIWG